MHDELSEHLQPNPSYPPDCFRLEDLKVFQSFESQMIADVNYYFWLNRAEGSDALPYRFLYFLELLFEDMEPLLLSAGEDSLAIRISNAQDLVQTARELQTLHGRVSMQRVNAGSFPLWQPVIGKVLEAIHLPRHENGLYANDALQLDFGERRIIVQLAQREGLELVTSDDLPPS